LDGCCAEQAARFGNLHEDAQEAPAQLGKTGSEAPQLSTTPHPGVCCWSIRSSQGQVGGRLSNPRGAEVIAEAPRPAI